VFLALRRGALALTLFVPSQANQFQYAPADRESEDHEEFDQAQRAKWIIRSGVANCQAEVRLFHGIIPITQYSRGVCFVARCLLPADQTDEASSFVTQ
jgi:hypothetical protein